MRWLRTYLPYKVDSDLEAERRLNPDYKRLIYQNVHDDIGTIVSKYHISNVGDNDDERITTSENAPW